jgi:hypothetical protein
MRTLAGLFGVSDNAVRKWCRSCDIPMPGPGFWNEVAARKRPYPNGVPDYD